MVFGKCLISCIIFALFLRSENLDGNIGVLNSVEREQWFPIGREMLIDSNTSRCRDSLSTCTSCLFLQILLRIEHFWINTHQHGDLRKMHHHRGILIANENWIKKKFPFKMCEPHWKLRKWKQPNSRYLFTDHNWIWGSGQVWSIRGWSICRHSSTGSAIIFYDLQQNV